MNFPDIVIARIPKNSRYELHVLIRAWKGCQILRGKKSSEGHSGEMPRLLLRQSFRGSQVRGYGLRPMAVPHGCEPVPQEA